MSTSDKISSFFKEKYDEVDSRLSELKTKIDSINLELDSASYKPRLNLFSEESNLDKQYSTMMEMKLLAFVTEHVRECWSKLRTAYDNKSTKLTLSDLSLHEVPSEIGYLTTLKFLQITGNQRLETLPPEIENLKGLEYLDLSNNGFRQLPNQIGKLHKLKTLNLSSNHISSLSPEMGQLKELTTLNLSYNRITEFSSEIGRLTNLTKLDLSNNPLVSLPIELRNLINLEELNLQTHKDIFYGGNKLPIPPEILVKTNEPQSILQYYYSTQLINPTINTIAAKNIGTVNIGIATYPLNEAKLLFLGQGSVDKTSLVQQIIHGTFDLNQPKTEGISINQWLVDDKQSTTDHEKSSTVNGPSSIKLNIWDFGGQEIMHATHQFFLTKRSLYLLVLDARLTQEENRVEYWLKIIQSFGGESPVLIVGNKTDQHPLDIDRTGLRKKYPNIVGILETSAKDGTGIEALKAEIAKQVDTLQHVRDLLPETWFTVKSKLEELGRDQNFITRDEYLNLCGANEVSDETSQHTLIGFLHDLGVVLHFQDDPRLEALGILNPQWVTNGVYKILNSHELFQHQGTLTLPLLNKILDLPEYPGNKRLFIVDMMKKFELCYDIEPDQSFLIPDLLPKDEIYTGEWDDALAFQYHYNVLPSSIITRFIVRMNAFIHQNTLWRTGVVLKHEGNTALVKADIEDKKIYIYVSGKQDTRRELLAMIRGGFDAIHKTIAKIEVTEKVPLPNAPEAAPVDLSFLQRAASEGRESLPVQVGNRIIDLIVKEVLGQIEKEGKGSKPANVYNIQNMYGAIGDNNTVNFIQQKFEPIYEAIESSPRDALEKEDLVAEIDEINDEVAKGDQANESFLSRRLRNLKKMAPDIAEVALSALAGPGAAFGTIVKMSPKRYKKKRSNFPTSNSHVLQRYIR